MKPSSIVTALVAAASMTATSAAPHNSTGVLSPRSDSPETINQVQAKLDQTPGSVWAVNCINDCHKRIACLGECLGKFDSEGQNKPDQAAKDKAVKGLPAVLTLIDCASTAGNICKQLLFRSIPSYSLSALSSPQYISLQSWYDITVPWLTLRISSLQQSRSSPAWSSLLQIPWIRSPIGPRRSTLPQKLSSVADRARGTLSASSNASFTLSESQTCQTSSFPCPSALLT